MKIFVPKEPEFENRCALIPSDAKRLIALGAEVSVEKGLGEKSFYLDAEYAQAGAKVVTDRDGSTAEADAVLRLRKPSAEDIAERSSAPVTS